ncbi:sugar ABC transporter permease [Streptomyces sp. NPDC060011]|uniref:sugar ABC transporter permease n=1 Tax=unclassified Streptomyces TaxID=2593676 RepID=UPI0013BD97B7|nr:MULTISPECIES: sugar ABC transporter permease [unclassified Streptomyces]NEB34302.1 sugar ABC transporter permease [Streptomyces sp. SID14446]MCX4917618.1 sugar ABC transporter permease [Streptomyces sp. NBC_00687]MCX5136162.1 sugar ABC transporter permease [Streptomyces sp. NBC_00340]MCX5279694.1 sugar ABC transporter permease [Streptomyces sp. NBC_00198]WSD77022.1 sugar ABC transporter permease [Streptomyces sp. NBC_01558]
MSIDKTSESPEDHAVPNPEAAAAAVPVVDPRLLVREQGVKGYVTEFKRKVKSGDLGSIPVVIGLIIIWAIFASLNSNFLTAGNLSDISVAMVGTGMIAVGIVFVLLLGEIDLSVGSLSGVAGATFAVLSVTHGMNEWLALVLAVLTGTVAGAIQGFFFARIGVPAFAVTLAGLLFWNGLMLQILGSNGTINLDSNGIVAKLTSYYFSDVAAAYALAIVVTAGYFLTSLFGNRRREAAGVPSQPLGEIIVRTALLAVLTLAVGAVYNQYKGLPLAVVIFVAVLLLTDFVLRRTAYGRKIFALGGSVEASRRAGINVEMVRISVFAISGTFAAIGGLFIASKIASANQGAGAGDLLMNAIAAAVIGGTSLFGGRGRTWNALLGVLVIVSIQYGLALQGIASPVQYMITGGVLLATVVIDAVTRKTQKSAGRA